ncbi:Ca-activated chloride channel family protein [Elusimicrobium simillimum]|uniref:VWA domain-containing protein n=1 Tax=Elusimicrobium simillimum TaxID=3143438 RepID=UPI003C6FD194
MTLLLKILFICLFIFTITFLCTVSLAGGRVKRNLIKACWAMLVLTLSVIALNVVVFIFFKDVQFANPKHLFLLVPLLLLWVAYPSMQKFLTPSIYYNMAYAPKRTFSTVLAKYFCFTLIILGLSIAVVALARPRDVRKTILPPTEGVDIILTLDISNSMNARDFSPTRMEAAKAAAKSFIEKRSADRIGIVLFATEAMLQSPLTLDYDSLTDFIGLVHTGMLRANSTAVGDALAVSIAHLQRSEAKSKIIILLTDGESNDGAITPLDAARSAAAMGIKIYTIATVGYKEGAYFDTSGLREVAALTGGRFFMANDNDQLDAVYSEIDSLEKTEFKNLTMVNYNDRYHPFLAVAVMLLTVSFICYKTIFMRVP